jgi:hypothetical protein
MFRHSGCSRHNLRELLAVLAVGVSILLLAPHHVSAASIKETPTPMADLSVRVSHPQWPFVAVEGIQFSRDGKHLAYMGRYDYAALLSATATNTYQMETRELLPACTTWRWVLDGKEQAEYDTLYASHFVFSPNGLRTAYAAQLRPKGKTFLGVPIGPLPDPKSGKWVCVVGGKAGGSYDAVRNPVFSEDSKRIAYAGQLGAKWVVVVDGRSSKQYDEVGIPVFSTNGKRVAFAARVGAKWRVITDKTKETEYDSLGTVVLSPDGQRMAFCVKRGEEWFMVVDGVEKGPFFDIQRPCFSPDSKRLAYTIKRGDQWIVTVDGAESAPYRGVTGALFSPDSLRVAFGAGNGAGAVVVLDGVEGKPYQVGCAPVFSPDSKRIAYAAQLAEKWIAVVDGNESLGCQEIGMPIFSLDSRHVAYAVRRASGFSVVIDGVEGSNSYDRLFTPGTNGFEDARSKMAFDDRGRLQFLAQRGTEVFRVEAELIGAELPTAAN